MLGKNKSIGIKPTFNERLHILNSEISEIQVTKDETSLFMSNLEKFI